MFSIYYQAVLRVIYDDWLECPPDQRPHATWVCAYGDMLSDGVDHPWIDTRLPPEQIWLLSSARWQTRSYWEWERFRTIQIERPWCLPKHERNDVFSDSEIGLAQFALYPQEQHLVYLFHKRGRTVRCESRLTLTPTGMVTDRLVLFRS